LPDHHARFLGELLQTLVENDYLKSKLDPLTPQLVETLAGLSSTKEDFSAWCSELELWVRWYRVPAFWLTNIFQLATKARGTIFHISACDLFSDAQSHFADDLALSSLETAYASFMRNRDRLGEAFAIVEKSIKDKLQYYHQYYYKWSRHFDLSRVNPCSDHLYSAISQYWLTMDAREEDPTFNPADIAALNDLIARADAGGLVYHSILARRFAGLIYAGDGKLDIAAQHLERALSDATRVTLDTEIGHLHRLLGVVLRGLGQLDAACQQFEQAVGYEQQEPDFIYTSYWQALSARELGDTRMRRAGRPAGISLHTPAAKAFIFDDLDALRPALQAYRVGRTMLNSHLTLQCPFPIGRAAKQELFRSFNIHAMQAAHLLKSTKDMLAEVEFSGPREATEVVTAISAVRETNDAALADFRRNRAVYYRALNTMPSRFEDYLENVAQSDAGRRTYLEQTFKLGGNLLPVQLSDDIVGRILDLRISDTIFLLFHLAENNGFVVAIDMSCGQGASVPLQFGEQQVREIDQDYQRKVVDSATRRQALDGMLSRYAELLAPMFTALLPAISSKHLKIFPRLQMNSVPLHALPVEGKRLIEHCATISYGQTLGLFLASRADRTNECALPLRIVLGRDVPWYEVLMPEVHSVYSGALDEIHDTSWPKLLEAISRQPASDTLFACHGQYLSDDLEASHLDLSADRESGQVAFSRVFAELDLHGCRSVIMGACESGLVRAEMGAEYVGLPSAMLSSGVRYVIGALWRIPQLATAILVGHYLKLVRQPGASVSDALCRAQRALISVSRNEVAAWISAVMPPSGERKQVLKQVDAMSEQPYAHPYFWAGLQVVGDV
jgi:tetratricopeptide (TPR) repeat protein